MAQADDDTACGRTLKTMVHRYVYDGDFRVQLRFDDDINARLQALYRDRFVTPDAKNFLCALEVIAPTDDELFGAAAHCMGLVPEMIKNHDHADYLVSIRGAKSLARLIFFFKWLQRREGWKFGHLPASREEHDDDDVDDDDESGEICSISDQVLVLQAEYPENEYVSVLYEIVFSATTVKSANKC